MESQLNKVIEKLVLPQFPEIVVYKVIVSTEKGYLNEMVDRYHVWYGLFNVLDYVREKELMGYTSTIYKMLGLDDKYKLGIHLYHHTI